MPNEQQTPQVFEVGSESAPPTASNPAQTVAPGSAQEPAEGSITWTASEYIAHHKSPGWYLLLTIAAVVVAVLVWLVTKDKISTAVIVFGALVIGIYAARKPRQLQYVLDDEGLTIGPKEYAYEDFRSFAIVPEGAFSSIVFMPLKRFAPLITIYYAPQDEAAIVDLLSVRLPHEDRKRDMVDSFMNRIRF